MPQRNAARRSAGDDIGEVLLKTSMRAEPRRASTGRKGMLMYTRSVQQQTHTAANAMRRRNGNGNPASANQDAERTSYANGNAT